VNGSHCAEVLYMALKEKRSFADIADHLDLSRQCIYDSFRQGLELGLISFTAPLEQQLAALIPRRYNCSAAMTVVDVEGPASGVFVASAASARVLDVIKAVAKRRPDKTEIGVGLGPGRATRDVCVELARMLHSSREPLPKLKLFAITAGGLASEPASTPVSFFNIFPQDIAPQSIALFAENLVTAEHFAKLRQNLRNHPGVYEAFEARDEIDIVITAMGDFEDEDDLLVRFLREAKAPVNRYAQGKPVGNVQYRPYSHKGPASERPDQLRAVTLFELSEFVERVDSGRLHVVLVARSCSRCGLSRANALRPLLTQASLKVWSEIVMDLKTARDLLYLRSIPHEPKCATSAANR
jgi:DNA-binding transcriptional regulator LsrR (DeoR family)